MQRICLAAALLVAFGLHGGAQAPRSSGAAEADTSPVSFEKAQSLASKGRLDQAMEMLDELAAQHPVPAGVERLRGIIFYQKEQLTQAIDAFSKASAQDPNDRESIEMHGVSLFRMGRPAEAIPLLEKAHAAVERANIDPVCTRLCYADVGRYDDARHTFACSTALRRFCQAYLLAGRLFLHPSFAIRQLLRARKLSRSIPLCPWHMSCLRRPLWRAAMCRELLKSSRRSARSIL